MKTLLAILVLATSTLASASDFSHRTNPRLSTRQKVTLEMQNQSLWYIEKCTDSTRGQWRVACYDRHAKLVQSGHFSKIATSLIEAK
jgi:hypothetical protein